MEYYVSVDGTDGNAGSRTKPFRTIGRAAGMMAAGDVCIVREGTYRETVRPKVGGSEGKPVRFVAAPGEVVVLKGTEPIAGRWSLHEGAIYRTQVDGTFEQLFVDDAMMIEARWPNARFDRLLNRETWAKTTVGSRYGKVVDPELAKTGVDWRGAVATLNVAHQFFSWTRTVVTHGRGSDTFTYDRDLPGITHFADKTTPWEQNVYFLSGKLEALDSPTEWFLDGESGTLYLWAPGGDDPGDHGVEAKVRDYGFEMEGLDYVAVEGFHFFGCTFRFQDCNHCMVDGCHLRFPTYARRLTDFEAEPSPIVETLMFGTHNTVQNSSLAHSATGGITMKGSYNTVENCLVHDLCWNGSLRYVGIKMAPRGPDDSDEPTEPGRCAVRRNTVFNTGNDCVMVRSMPDYVVEYNHIHHGGLAAKDVALLGTALPLIRGSELRYNWVHDNHAEHIALGIRGDDQTRGLTVHHNVVWNCGWDGIVVKGDHNRVYHNTCFDNGQLDMLLFCEAEPVKPWRKQWPLLDEQNAHTERLNNCAAKVRGARGGDVPPGGQAGHNFADALADPAQFDFRPKEASPLIDAGRIIPGINDGYIGRAPDVGAYEYGGERWVAGYRNGIEVSDPEPGAGDGGATALWVWLRMPPLEAVRVTVAAEEADVSVEALTFTPEDWMQPQTVRITGTGSVRFHAEEMDPIAISIQRSGQGNG